MAEIGMDAHGIEASLRYNRPQTVEEEQYLLYTVAADLKYAELFREYGIDVMAVGARGRQGTRLPPPR
jgi:hypothetical protein